MKPRLEEDSRQRGPCFGDPRIARADDLEQFQEMRPGTFAVGAGGTSDGVDEALKGIACARLALSGHAAPGR